MYILSIGANIKGLWSLWPPIKYLRGPPPKLMSIAIRMGHVLCNVISCVGWVFLPPKKMFYSIWPPWISVNTCEKEGWIRTTNSGEFLHFQSCWPAAIASHGIHLCVVKERKDGTHCQSQHQLQPLLPPHIQKSFDINPHYHKSPQSPLLTFVVEGGSDRHSPAESLSFASEK